MPYEPPYQSTPAIDGLCTEIGELIGRLTPSAPLSTSIHLHRELRIITIYSSLAIEGNRLTQDQTTAVLDGQRVLGPNADIRAVENANRAYELIGELDPLSERDLLRAHAVMMDGLTADAGRLRSGNVGVFAGDVLVHAGTPARYVPETLANLFGWLRDTPVHPLVASCIFHYEFEFIHPFSDGNGRIGRLWQTAILARWRPVLQWLPVESVILDRQQGYYDALAESDGVGSSEAFVAFMLEAIRDALLAYGPSATDGGTVPSSDRSKLEDEALAYFASHERGSIPGMAEALGISKRTAERVVAGLRKDGRLRREGAPRSGRWIVAGS